MSDRRLTVQEMDELEQEARRRIRHPDGVGDEPMALNPVGVLALLAAAREGAEWVRGMEEGLARGLEHRRSAEARIKELCAALERIASDDAGANVGWMREIAAAALAGKGEG